MKPIFFVVITPTGQFKILKELPEKHRFPEGSKLISGDIYNTSGLELMEFLSDYKETENIKQVKDW